jgi:TM2 domain-containing membrane protein YozV
MADAKKDNTMAIVGLILNIIILPGLGTLVGGGKSRVTTGILQLVLFLIGIPLSIVIIGIPLMIGMWIWALVTGIQMVKEA